MKLIGIAGSGVLGVVCMFMGIVGIGIVGNCTRWYQGVIALCIAILLIFSSICLIWHALDLIDDAQNCTTKTLDRIRNGYTP